MGKEKADLIHSEDAMDKASKGLEKVKEMERNLRERLKTIILPNGVQITSNRQEIINDYISNYGKL